MAIELQAAKADDTWLAQMRARIATQGAVTWEEALLLLLHIEWQADEQERLAYERDRARDELATAVAAIPVH